MPHANGTPDRIVHDDADGAAGGGLTDEQLRASPVLVDVTPAAPAANDYLPVRLTDGTDFYNATGGGGGGGAVTVADGADVNAGATTDVAVTSDANGTLSGKLRGLVRWAYERMPSSLGQKLMAASFPVTLASDQPAVPISAASLPLPAGAATAANQQTDALTDTQLRAAAVPVDGSGVTQPISAAALPLPTGAATAANQQTDALTNTQLRATPVPVSATDLDTRDLTFANDKVDASGTVLGTGSNEIGTVRQPASTGARLDALANDVGKALGAGGVILYNDVLLYGFNGTTWDRLRSDIANGLDVDVTRLPALPAGDNNIGNVDVFTLPSIPAGTNHIGDVGIQTIAPGQNRIGGVYQINGGIIDENGTVQTVKVARITTTASGDTTVVAAVASRKIRVLKWAMTSQSSSLLAAEFRDGAGTTLSMKMSGMGSGTYYDGDGPANAFEFETAVGQLLKINLSSAPSTAFHVHVVYIEVA